MLCAQGTYRLFVMYALITLISGCSWTPQVETSIYEDPQVSVSLITVSEESFEADHPVTFQANTLAHVLSGLYLHQNKRLLQRIFSSDNSLQPVFTQKQATILTHQLQKAFSQVTPEEHVAFQTQGDLALHIKAIKGSMYMQGEDLYVTLTFPPPGAHAATKIASRSAKPDQEANGKPVLVFKPQEALLKEKNPHWLLGGEEKNHVVINIPLLASLHQQPSPSSQIAKPRNEEASPPKTAPLSPPESIPQPQTGQTLENSETKTLQEEIRALRKELADQKKAIDQLKQKERELR